VAAAPVSDPLAAAATVGRDGGAQTPDPAALVRLVGGPMLQRWRLLDRYRVYLLEARHRTPRTYAEYRRTLLDLWAHAGKEPDQLTARDLHRFLYGRRLSDATRKTYTAHAKAFYRWAAARQLLPRDPLVDYATPPAPLGPPRSLDLRDVERLIRYAYSQPRLHLCIWLAYGCGLRCAEVAALRIEDCQPSGRRPHIRVRGKGGRERVVPLHPDVAWVLGCALVELPGTGPVVQSEVDPGCHIGAKHVSRLLNQATHGLRPPLRATAHQLRHTFATEILAGGGTERAVGILLGHVDPKSTRRYTAAYDADAWAAVLLLPNPVHPPAN